MPNKAGGVLFCIGAGLGALILALATRKPKKPEIGLRGIDVTACYDTINKVVKVSGLWEQYGYSDANFTIGIIIYPEGGTRWGPPIQEIQASGLKDGKQILSVSIPRRTVLIHGDDMGGISGYYTVGFLIRAIRNGKEIASYLYTEPRRLFINLVAGTIEPECGIY